MGLDEHDIVSDIVHYVLTWVNNQSINKKKQFLPVVGSLLECSIGEQTTFSDEVSDAEWQVDIICNFISNIDMRPCLVYVKLFFGRSIWLNGYVVKSR